MAYGTILKIDNDKYRVCFDFGNNNQGKRIRKYEIFDSKKEADQAFNKHKVKMDDGTFVLPKNITFGEWLDYWIENIVTQKVEATTLYGYTGIVDRYLKEHLGGAKLQKLRPKDIQEYYTMLLTEKKLSPNTVIKHHNLLTNTFKTAEKHEYINKNPMNEDAIRMFIITKIFWIKRQQEKFKNQPRQSEREYVSGESVYVWDKRYRLEVVYSSNCNDVQIKGDRLLLQVREASTTEQRANVLNAWYRKNIKKEIPLLIEKWQKVIGVVASDWGVKNMKTRWGTCNVKAKRIWLNLQLAKKHNKTFIAYMDNFLLDWRTTKDELNG